jgi:hypothetical protein
MHLKTLFYLLIVPIIFLSFEKDHDSVSNKEFLQREQAVEYRVVVKIIGDEWRVVLENDDSKSDITLRRGDRIRWVVQGSDASFQFPEIGIFGMETRTVKDGNPLVLAVRENSPPGNYPYTVFVHASMTYARGQSPPRIIVMN